MADRCALSLRTSCNLRPNSENSSCCEDWFEKIISFYFFFAHWFKKSCEIISSHYRTHHYSYEEPQQPAEPPWENWIQDIWTSVSQVDTFSPKFKYEIWIVKTINNLLMFLWGWCWEQWWWRLNCSLMVSPNYCIAAMQSCRMSNYLHGENT